jgi:hypothetical protein
LDRADQADEWTSDEERDAVSVSLPTQILGRVVWSAGVGEAAALYALASGESTAFLAGLTIFPMLRVMPELLRAHRARFVPLRDEWRQARAEAAPDGQHRLDSS